MAIEFKNMGHVASAQGWKVTVNGDGSVTLESAGSLAYYSGLANTYWSKDYTAEQWRELTELFTGAMELLSAVDITQWQPMWEIGQELTLADLKKLPVGAVVYDGDGSVNRDEDLWTKATSDRWVNVAGAVSDRTGQVLFGSTGAVTLVSLP